MRCVMSRVVRIAPIVFAVVGASVGLSLAMLFRQDPRERAHVPLDDSMPFFVWGTVAGCGFGCMVVVVCACWPRLVPVAGMVALTLLGAAVGAPLGWIEGDSGVERLPQYGMICGVAVGAVLGAGIGVIQWLLKRKFFS
jgi:hypothetical protein